jgi:hypothetical protein
MHPLGLYLAVTDSQHEHGSAPGQRRRASFAKVDALPITEPEPVTRIRRLTGIVRRRVMRTAGA